MRATVIIKDDVGNVIIRESFIEPIETVVTPVEDLMDPNRQIPSKTTWFKFGVTEYMNSPIKTFIRSKKEEKK